MEIENPRLTGISTGFGVPTAGTSGQIITKVDGINYNTQWSNPKSVTYPIVEIGIGGWINLGRWTTSQDGKVLYIRIVSHVGYNATSAQPQVTELIVSTSNGVQYQNGSTGASFYAAANASINTFLGTGNNAYGAPYLFRIVQVSTTQYDVYTNVASYANGIFTADVHNSDTWTPNGTAVSAPGGNYIAVTPKNSEWSTREATNISAINVPPTKPTTRIQDYTRYRLTGNKSATVQFNMTYIANTGAVAGSGQYLFSLPLGISFDTSVHALSTSDNSNNNVNNATLAVMAYSIPCTGFIMNDGIDSSTSIAIVPYSTTTYRVIYGWGTGESTIVSSSYNSMITSRLNQWQFDINIT